MALSIVQVVHHCQHLLVINGVYALSFGKFLGLLGYGQVYIFCKDAEYTVYGRAQGVFLHLVVVTNRVL